MRYGLITGGMGFIGSFVAKQLLEQNYADKVVCLDHFGRYVPAHRSEFYDYRRYRMEMLGESVAIEREKNNELCLKLCHLIVLKRGATSCNRYLRMKGKKRDEFFKKYQANSFSNHKYSGGDKRVDSHAIAKIYQLQTN